MNSSHDSLFYPTCCVGLNSLYLVHHMAILVKVQQKVSVKSPSPEAGQRPEQRTPINPSAISGVGLEDPQRNFPNPAMM